MKVAIPASCLFGFVIGLPACGPADGSLRESEQQVGTAEQPLLCPPEGPCGGGGTNPKDPKDPPPPRPTFFYPAEGWSVINGSEANNLRGVQWWAYRWEGNKLKVKAYYPADYGTGIVVGTETAHAFLTFEVTSPVQWRAWSNVNLQRPWGVKEQNGYMDSYLDANGVISQYATQAWHSCNGDVCETREYYGIYQDDGSGSRLVQGEDALTSVGAGIIASFLNDFTENGGLIAPPSLENTCGDECLTGLQLYLERQQQYLANLTNPDNPPYIPCGAAGGATAVCGFAAIVLYSGWFLPPVWLTGATLTTICMFAAGNVLNCGHAIESYDPPAEGTCVRVVTPRYVTGPDGRTTQIIYVIESTAACK
jgi:hypothetical protein